MSELGQLSIRPLRTIAEYRACEQLQSEVWGFRTQLDVVPLTQLLAVQDSGGLVLGAFTPTGQLRGFCYGFLGREANGRLLHHSHMTAVDVQWQSVGLGERLKWAQRRAVLDQGVELMAWTFDPLESRNACFNFSKLGVVADTYREDYYGNTGSALHAGTPTDRLRVWWELQCGRVERRSSGRRGVLAERLRRDPSEWPMALAAVHVNPERPAPAEPDLALGASQVLCEIPASIQELKGLDRDLATAWRLATRRVFVAYLGRGYAVRECVRTTEAVPRTLYLLATDC